MGVAIINVKMGDALKVDSVFHCSPVTKDFSALPPEELKDFFSYFIDNLPYCLGDLIQEVWKAPEFEYWVADFSAESLLGLGEWFARKIEIVNFSDEQLKTIKSADNVYLSSLTWRLTDHTLALAVYV